jgi:ketosteroid isomerase-like protein
MPCETLSKCSSESAALGGLQSNISRAELVEWLDAFAAAVRSVDYPAGRAMFADDVVGFGTVGVMLKGLATLEASQWRHVWGVTSGFHFHIDHLAWGESGEVAWAAVPWTSWGRDPHGQTFERRGRGTYILHRRGGRLLAVHTHHSLDPAAR